jgi:DNA polymerase-1
MKAKKADLYWLLQQENRSVSRDPPGLFHLTHKDWPVDYRLVDTPELFRAFLKELHRQRRLVFDLETTGLDALAANIVGIAFCWRPGEAYYLPLLGPPGSPTLDYQSTLEALRPVLEDVEVAKLNQNIKFDVRVLLAHNIRVCGIRGDTLIADYLLRPDEHGRDEDTLARLYLNYQPIPISDLIGARGKSQTRMDEVPTWQVALYAGEDADVALRLAGKMDANIAANGLSRLYEDVEVPLISVLAEMEQTGVLIDVPFLQKMGLQIEPKLKDLEKESHDLAGAAFNLNSPGQLANVLYKKQGLPILQKTDSGKPSTDKDTLEKLAAQGHRLPAVICEFKKLKKLKGTYVDSLPGMVNPKTGRIHASFNQAVAATGRLSSSDPNLLALPKRDEIGCQIRRAVIASSDWVLVKADYSQIELRILAHLSGDKALREVFHAGGDIHTSVAARIHNVPDSVVTPEMRNFAKTINFGVIYGMSAHGLAMRLRIPKIKAEEFIDQYYRQFSGIADFQNLVLRQCREFGYTRTELGRRRPIQGIRSWSTYRDRNGDERKAINTPVQSSATDLFKLAILCVHRRLKREKHPGKLLLPVHDELVLETPRDRTVELAAIVKEEMEGVMKLSVPLLVEVAAGPNWLDVKPVTVP